VLTDLTGQSGLAVLEAILAGERNPRTLAGLVSRRVKQSPAQIEAALTGDYRAEALFVVEQALQSYHHLQQQIAQCDLAIEKQVAALGDCPTPPPTGEPSAPVPRHAISWERGWCRDTLFRGHWHGGPGVIWQKDSLAF
jgi:hypothetical protein